MSKESAYHHGDLRAALLKAARKRLARDGYEALSLRELARDAGVAASAPYAHFKNRDDLFAALIQDGAVLLGRLFRSAAQLDASPQARLAAACRAYLDFSQRKRELFRLMFGSPVAPSPTFEAEAQATLDQFESLVAAATGMDDAQAAGEVAVGCWSTMHGFAMLRLHQRLNVAIASEGGEELVVAAVLRLARRP